MPKCCIAPVYSDRATIQRNSALAGDPAEDFTGSALATRIPCNVRTISGDETYRGRQLEAHVTHVVDMRYRSGIQPTMRLRIDTGIYKDRVLNITNIRPVRKPGEIPTLELYCRELADT